MAFCASVSLMLRAVDNSIFCVDLFPSQSLPSVLTLGYHYFAPAALSLIRADPRSSAVRFSCASKFNALAPRFREHRAGRAESSRIEFIRAFEASDAQKRDHAHASGNLQKGFHLVFHEAFHRRGVIP